MALEMATLAGLRERKDRPGMSSTLIDFRSCNRRGGGGIVSRTGTRGRQRETDKEREKWRTETQSWKEAKGDRDTRGDNERKGKEG